MANGLRVETSFLDSDMKQPTTEMGCIPITGNNYFKKF